MPLTMLLAACSTDASVSHVKLPKSHVAPHFDCLGNAKVPWTQCLHHMIPGHQWCHITKRSYCNHFSNLELRNAVVPLMVLSTSQVNDTNTNGIMWCQCSCQWDHITEISQVAPHFNCLKHRIAVMPLIMLLAWCDTDASGIKWPKSHVAPHFNGLT